MTVFCDNPILDMRALRAQLDEDDEALRALLAMFLEDAQSILDELRALRQHPDQMKRLMVKAHGLKGACANLGADTLRARCLALEVQARDLLNGEPAETTCLDALIDEMDTALGQVHTQAKAWLDAIPSGETGEPRPWN